MYYFWYSSMLLYVSSSLVFPLLNYHHNLFIIHLLVDIWIISSFRLFWKYMLWTFLYIFVNICFCFFGYIPTSINVGQFYKKLSNIFPKCLYHFTPTSYVWVQLLSYLYQYLVLPVLWIFITYWVCSGISFGFILHFTNKKRCQNLFVSLLGTQIPSFVKCLHNILPILKFCIPSLLICRCSLYILDRNLLY